MPLAKLKEILPEQRALSFSATRSGDVYLTSKDHEFLEKNFAITYPHVELDGAIVWSPEKGVDVAVYDKLNTKPFSGTEEEREKLVAAITEALLQEFTETAE